MHDRHGGRLADRLADACRALVAPVGLRYHALHHWIPSLPYHNLGRAHRVLVATLRSDAPYHATVERGFLPPLRDLLRRSRTRPRSGPEMMKPILPGAGDAGQMRIGICAPYDLGRDGGVNSHIRAQARALRALGHEVCVFGASSAPLADGERALSGCISPVVGGTETPHRPRSTRVVAGGAAAADRAVRRPPHARAAHAARAVVRAVAGHGAGGRHVPHASRAGPSLVWPVPWLLAPLMRRIHTRLAVSDAARRTVARDFPGDYEIVPNGIDVERFRQPAPRPAGMPDQQRFVLFVGRLEPRKGVDRLIRAMAIVQHHAPDVRLAIVGDGPDRAALEAAARDAGVDVLFTGRVSDAALPAYYRAADIVCSPALGDESFGIVLLEAMAAERPIVATRIEGYAEMLAEQEAPGSSTSTIRRRWPDEITSLLADPDCERSLGARGAAFVRDYDWTAIARRLESIYRSLL